MELPPALAQASPLKKLIQSPQIFEFFQAVRLLLNYAAANQFPVGRDHDYQQEAVRFKALAALRFPISEIYSITPDSKDNTAGRYELELSFLGLYGPAGILPNYYTELIIQRLQEKDTALRDFLDLFNHRIISLFYRTWEKHHFFAYYEREKSEKKLDPFSKTVSALIGNGITELQNRSLIPDETFWYYAGLFAHSVRSASALRMILADYFAVPVEIEQFQGKWLSIPAADRTCLTSAQSAGDTYNQLGCNTLLGQRTWDTQGSFKIKIGPLSYPQFQQFLPGGNELPRLMALTRRYIGINFNFAVQLILKKEHVPGCRLDGTLHLGWGTWLKSKSMPHNVADTHLSEKYKYYCK